MRAILPNIRDLHVYGGAAVVGFGVWQVYPPATWIVVGAFLVYLGRPWR